MRTLQQYLSEAKVCSADGFVKRYPDAILLVRKRRTATTKRAFQTAVMLRSEFEQADETEPVIFPLSKRNDAAYTDHVSIGRTRSMDVCLEYADVSKFHAYFRKTENGSIYTLTDAGATNGTFVDERRLGSGEAVQISNATALRFGACEVTFYSARGFHEYLQELLRNAPVAQAGALPF